MKQLTPTDLTSDNSLMAGDEPKDAMVTALASNSSDGTPPPQPKPKVSSMEEIA